MPSLAVAKEPKKEVRPERKALNVSPDAHRLVTKIAAHREMTIEELFDSQDVREFLNHLLVEEMRKEEQRLKGKK